MKSNTPNIISRSVEQFNVLSKAIDALSEPVFQQIETVESGLVGITCTLKVGYETEHKYTLPFSTRQIHDFGDYIGIYTKDIFFKIPKKDKMILSYIIEEK